MFHFTPFASTTLIFGFVPLTSSLSNLNGGFGRPSSLPTPRLRLSFDGSPRPSHRTGRPASSGPLLLLFFFPFCASRLLVERVGSFAKFASAKSRIEATARPSLITKGGCDIKTSVDMIRDQCSLVSGRVAM